MNNFKKLSQKFKKIATTMLSVCALACTVVGTSFLITTADTTTDTTTEAAYTKVAHYEFNDADNLGKDSLGNHHLINAGGVVADEVNGGAIVGNENGYLYASPDFSDDMTGSYSLSLRAYLRSGSGGTHFLASTGYVQNGTAFSIYQSWGNIIMYYGNTGNAQSHTFELGLTSTKAWYRITMMYNEADLSFRLMATKEGDASYSFDETATLTAATTFGGSTSGVFTIGGRSTGAGSSTNLASHTPTITDFRIYEGVIDETEITAIKNYDLNRAKAIAHYEFNDATNFGKDSLGNNDLINAGGVVADTVNGGVTIGDSTTKGYLYASGTRTTDFTDSMDGSYSVSVRAYLKEVSSGGNVIVSTSNAYSGKFDVRYAYTNINLVVNGTSYSVYNQLNATAAWYRITAIYDEENLTYKTIVLKEGETTATETSIPITVAIPFGDPWGLFAVGARTNGDGDTMTWNENAECDGFLPSISDLRIYSGVINDAELAKIAQYDEENAAKKAVADNSEIVGAAIRVVGEPGLRFLAQLNESVVNEYVTKYGAENVSFGMKVVRDHNGALAYAYVPAANKTLNNGVYAFNAVITGMTEEYYDTNYTAQVYISYTVDGETTYVVSEESKTRSITFVAEAALGDTYVVGTNGTLEEKPEKYKYEISEGVWSPYSTTLRTTLEGYVVEEEA